MDTPTPEDLERAKQRNHFERQEAEKPFEQFFRGILTLEELAQRLGEISERGARLGELSYHERLAERIPRHQRLLVADLLEGTGKCSARGGEPRAELKGQGFNLAVNHLGWLSIGFGEQLPDEQLDGWEEIGKFVLLLRRTTG